VSGNIDIYISFIKEVSAMTTKVVYLANESTSYIIKMMSGYLKNKKY